MSARWLSVVLLLVLLSTGPSMGLSDPQARFQLHQGDEWTVELSTEWDVLGPFPIHAREQHFLSPSFPLNLSQPIDFHKSWPSSYADGGLVSWSTVNATDSASPDPGNLKVSFPHIRWSALRATEGWAALQHHAVLHTTLTVHAPQPLSESESQPEPQAVLPNLIVTLTQGAFFTILPAHDAGSSLDSAIVPEWYSGNIYAMERAPPKAVRFPAPPSARGSTTYDVFVSGDYEIRLFGDPTARGEDTPTLDITMTAALEPPGPVPVVRQATHDVACDFVDGFAFGDALGVGLRSVAGWWTVDAAAVPHGVRAQGLDVALVRPQMTIAPGQTRIVPLRIAQDPRAPFAGDSLTVELTLASGTSRTTVSATLPIRHRAHALDGPRAGTGTASEALVQASYFFAGAVPTAFNVLLPLEPTPRGERPRPPVLALHGAGVDVLADSFWADAIPRQNLSWVVMPAGRTSWGLDWHGPSAQDAWQAVDALGAILARAERWGAWRLAPDPQVLVLGHSNGGQGAWYLAARFPDRVVGAVPAAAYIKAQAYVPLTQSRSAHFIDPSLRALLETSFTPDDNDLFMSNLVDTPILAIHGGSDENVPTWHTRELVSTLKTWNPAANITYHEAPGEPHWYPSVFKNEQVAGFLRSILQPEAQPERRSRSFTLTVALPAESGPLHGWRILTLATPGRLARLTVQEQDGAVSVRTSNVASFSFDVVRARVASLKVDGAELRLPDSSLDAKAIHVKKTADGWEPRAPRGAAALLAPQPSGRLATILQSAGPLTIVVPALHASSRALSVAHRLAHDLDVYHKLDAEIVADGAALQRLGAGELGPGNVVVVGMGGSGDAAAEGRFARQVLGLGKTAFGMDDGAMLTLRGQRLDEPSQGESAGTQGRVSGERRELTLFSLGAIFLHPHPTNSSASMLFMIGSDLSGLERIARLFPIRTGISLPDWLVIEGEADTSGAAGVQAAGLWDAEWSWKEVVSWHH
ncbi:hypothetical protein HETIRDRAFT_150141 [Heterobasidion irregulare TC 32-1]|uniref:Peptidase S9 prolyl oligopeptidase catalytic domain-containing protein n=1 Tax=Heterobasidion irregulare (strain TC 32-1) TaxID=747525 RepID=W4KIG4_HETIT|nr:uncharacterized protein HETIRDRAFT_150141 [Heterobasidion irregulare TC 32-1]ETW85653.1 hypothetical protein HETIRDRAFT_150141 [Heterobasidion irregulare TC 32-1]